MSLLVDSITSFSDRPLVLIFYLGLAIGGTSSLAAVYLVVRRLFFGVALPGWPSLIVSIWMLGGLMLICLGIIGIYLSQDIHRNQATSVYDRPADLRTEPCRDVV